MKPPNHGMRVLLDDGDTLCPLVIEGWLIYRPADRNGACGDDRASGLAIREYRRSSALMVWTTDRIEVLR